MKAEIINYPFTPSEKCHHTAASNSKHYFQHYVAALLHRAPSPAPWPRALQGGWCCRALFLPPSPSECIWRQNKIYLNVSKAVVLVLTTCHLSKTLCCCCCCWVTSVVSDSVRPHRRQPTRLPRPWDSPGKNTGAGCHFLFQCMKLKSESEDAQSCPILSNSFQAPPSMGFSRQEYWKEWGAIAFSGRNV